MPRLDQLFAYEGFGSSHVFGFPGHFTCTPDDYRSGSERYWDCESLLPSSENALITLRKLPYGLG